MSSFSFLPLLHARTPLIDQCGAEPCIIAPCVCASGSYNRTKNCCSTALPHLCSVSTLSLRPGMGCNCDCYCGCATRSNRMKYLASGVLFCVWCLLQFYTSEQVQACQDNYPPGATVDALVASDMYYSVCSILIQGVQGMRAECAVHDVRLDRGERDRSIPVMCEEAYGKRIKCLLDKTYAPLNVFLSLLKLFALVGFIVPLGMMCCCTTSPHKVCFLDCLVPLSHWNSSQYMEFNL